MGRWIAGALVVIALFWGIGSYNGHVTNQERARQTLGQVQNVCQRRYDLIPNLVATVKGYTGHEHTTLVDVQQARSAATQITLDPATLTPEKLRQFEAAQGELSAALGRLMVVQENYPNLKADTQFQSLMAELSGTENRISVERRAYTKAVETYNVGVRTFPGSFTAKFGSFPPMPQFEADAAAQKAPTVQF